MKKPIRTTLFFGLLSALCVIPFTEALTSSLGWLMAYKIFILLNLTLYSVLLCRWSKSSPVAIIFPLLLLLGVALWPYTYTGCALAALAVFSWIRSGICFKSAPIRAMIAETATVAASAGFMLFWWPSSTLAQPLAIWLFFLIQTLYFYIVPGITKQCFDPVTKDSFEQACREVERLLDNNPAR
jgi:hypothetical protein